MFTTTRSCVCAIGASLFITTTAQAGMTETFKSDPFSETTDWTTTFQLPQFDDMGGTRILQSVDITLEASVAGLGQTENLETWEHHITLSLEAFFSLDFLDEPLITPMSVDDEVVFVAQPFDGTVDFDGPSGGMFDLDAALQAAISQSAPSDLAPWIGGGMVDLVGRTQVFSTATGPGNVTFNFESFATAQVSVVYTYIPTPGAWSMIALSALLMIPRSRRPMTRAA